MPSIHSPTPLHEQRLKIIWTLSSHTENVLQGAPKIIQLLGNALHSESIRKEQQLPRRLHISVPDYIEFSDGVDLQKKKKEA
jgi:hypothetical protein